MNIKRNVSKTPKKVKLEESPLEPTLCIAICSTENGYRLSWLLNKSLNVNLTLYSFTENNSQEIVEDCYLNKDANLPLLLFANKLSNGACVFPKYKQFDYIVVFFGQFIDTDLKDLFSKIKKTEGVITATEIEGSNKMLTHLLSLF